MVRCHNSPFWSFPLLHVELSHDDLRQIGMEKKQEGEQSDHSKPTEGIKQPAISGKSAD